MSRPVSPHLQIYRPQLTSVLSILHRFTGIVLAVGSLLLVWWVISAGYGPEAFNDAQRFFGHWAGLVILFLWSAALFYHLCNGIRHLAWDAGWGFEIPQVYRSGYAVVAAAAALTLGTWALGLCAW